MVNPVTGKHFGGSLSMIPMIEEMGFIALTAFVINVVVAAAVTVALRATKVSNGVDATQVDDYFADAGDPRVEPVID